MIEMMPDWLDHIVFPVTRWLHIVATALLVGGVLFYEFVIPKALDEMKDEHQMAVFGRVRWFFSKVVYISALILLLTGAMSAWKAWDLYQHSDSIEKPGFWFVLHSGLGLIALAIALRLTLSPRMPPLSWMRVNFVLLLVVIFLAGLVRHVRTAIEPVNRPSTGTSAADVRSGLGDVRSRVPLLKSDDETDPATLTHERASDVTTRPAD